MGQSPSQGLKERDTSLDLIRIIAFLSVISVHFFLNSGFYDQPVVGNRMYVMVLLRSFFMNCVPLFMILSGYLLNRKKVSVKYYVGGLKTVFIYVLASIFCLVYMAQEKPISIGTGFLMTLDFSAAPYAWYIEMYLGLFLLIPFLNLVYHGLENKKQKQFLLFIMLSMTALPLAINIDHQIIPAWWSAIYPLTYYFIGAYLSEYLPKIKIRYLLVLLCLHVICMGSFCFIRSYNATFEWGMWCDWGSLSNTITAVLVFMIVKKIPTKQWNWRIKTGIKYISSLCLGAYLLSWIFDTMYYPILAEKVPEMIYRLEYMPIMIIAVATSALLLSVVVTFIGSQLMKYVRKAVK